MPKPYTSLKSILAEFSNLNRTLVSDDMDKTLSIIGSYLPDAANYATENYARLTDVQTTLVPPGGATMVEFKLEVPGRYILVDHALSRLERGLAGFLMVEGDANPDIFDGTLTPGSGH